MTQRRRLKFTEINNILKCFVADIEASKAAKICMLNRNTINKYFTYFRKLIDTHYTQDIYFKNTVCEVDEAFFGPRRPRKHGPRYDKTIVFGIIERGGLVYATIVPDTKTRTLIKIIEKRIDKSCVVYSDDNYTYRYLSGRRYHHERVNHSAKEFVRGEVHTNNIESFWSYCKRRLHKFKGIPKETFRIHLKESVYRFNLRKGDLYVEMIQLIKKDPFLSSLWYH